MIKREYVAIAISSAIAVVGAAINFFYSDSGAFPRAGSLIVCVAIGFGLRDLRDVYKAKFESFAVEQEEKRLENDIVFSDAEIEVEVRGSTDQRIKVAETKAEKHGVTATTIDAGILIGGTLIWGFGDLLL